MSPQLIVAVVTILLAAVLYTIAVFAERRAGKLSRTHLVLFWTGLVSDTTATTLMSGLSGGFKLDVHGVLGVLAIAVMGVHALWATVALVQARPEVLGRFHRFSLAVWAVWMASLVTGFGLAIPRMLG